MLVSTYWVEVMNLPLTSFVAQGRLFNLCEPSFLIHKIGGYHTCISGRLRWILKWVEHKHYLHKYSLGPIYVRDF